MKVIDDGCKKLHWWNRNYFFIGTIIIIAVNILLFWLAGNDWESVIGDGSSAHWGAAISFNNIIRLILNAFSHSSWQHVLLNMLCFLIVGIYLERKKGTFSFMALVLVMTFLSSLAIGANRCGIGWHGFSGANYALYAYVIVDYVFMFVSKKWTKTNIIYGAIMIALIYLAMCANDGATFSFEWYPYDLIYNMGHYSSMLAGMVFSMALQVTKLFAKKEEFITKEKK